MPIYMQINSTYCGLILANRNRDTYTEKPIAATVSDKDRSVSGILIANDWYLDLSPCMAKAAIINIAGVDENIMAASVLKLCISFFSPELVRYPYMGTNITNFKKKRARYGLS